MPFWAKIAIPWLKWHTVAQNEPKNGPTLTETARKRSKMVQNTFLWLVLIWVKNDQNGPIWPKNGPNWPKKMAQKGPKMAQKMAKNGSEWVVMTFIFYGQKKSKIDQKGQKLTLKWPFLDHKRPIFLKIVIFGPGVKNTWNPAFFAPNLCQKPFLMVFGHFWDFSIFPTFWTYSKQIIIIINKMEKHKTMV